MKRLGKLNTSLSSITPFTLIDYPEHIACILWFAGCNLRCKYCHNHELVIGPFSNHSTEDALNFLDSRVGMLDGVVLSGGECTLSPNFYKLCRKIKQRGFDLKIDTNGARPNVIKQLIDEKLVDYVALDYKAPKNKFKEVTQKDGYNEFSQTLDLLLNTPIPFEVRTTVHSAQLQAKDIQQIIDDLASRGYQKTYYIQNYIDRPTEKPSLAPLPPHSESDIKKSLNPQNVNIRFRNFKEIA